MDGDDFSQRYRDALSEMEARYREDRDALDASWRRAVAAQEERVLAALADLLDDAARARARDFRDKMADVEARFDPDAALASKEAESPEASGGTPSLDDLEVRSLHLVAQLDASLRHSIVEACLMNLRGFADVLDERAEDPTFLEKVGGQIQLLPGVAQQVVDFFHRPVVFHLALKDLLPVAYKVALVAVQGVLRVVERFQAGGAGPVPVPGRELARRIDALAAALSEVRKVLDARRASLAAVVRQGVDALRPTVEGAGGELVFRDRTDGEVRLFLNEARLANAVGELVRNAVRHGGSNGGPPPRIEVAVREDPVPATTVRIVVEDDGGGFPADVLARAGDEAVSTAAGGAGLTLVREAAEEHFGSVTVENRSEGGARVSLALPRHPPRE